MGPHAQEISYWMELREFIYPRALPRIRTMCLFSTPIAQFFTTHLFVDYFYHLLCLSSCAGFRSKGFKIKGLGLRVNSALCRTWAHTWGAWTHHLLLSVTLFLPLKWESSLPLARLTKLF